MAPLAAVALLAAMAVVEVRRPEPADAEPFHARVREVVDALPLQFGHWVGVDEDVPPAATKLLKPNRLFNREYRNLETSRMATFLMVQCKQAGDLAGHYPPNCYPAHGWTTRTSEQVTWRVDDLEITGTEYLFSISKLEQNSQICIRNFMILPDGRIYPGMRGVAAAAADYNRHFFGAAQIQVVTNARMPSADRDKIFNELIRQHRSLIDVLRGRVQP